MKKYALMLITVIMLLSNVFVSFASFTYHSGAIQPCTYVFSLVLAANGLISDFNIDNSYIAYKKWLENRNDNSSVQALNSLSNVSWGGTYSDIQNLYNNVNTWLLSTGSYGTENSVYKSSMKKSVPVEWVTLNDSFSVQAVPYSMLDYNKNPVVASGNYDYLFSDSYTVGNSTIYKRNNFKPKNSVVFGICDGLYSYSERIKVSFYIKDSASSSGYSPFDLTTVWESYNINTHVRVDGCGSVYLTTFGWLGVDAKWLSLLPFPVFFDTASASEYCRTGSTANALGSNEYPFIFSSVHPRIQKLELLSLDSSIKLPSSASDALANLNSLKASDVSGLPKAINDCGMGISWKLPYTVSFYTDGKLTNVVEEYTDTLNPVVSSLDIPKIHGCIFDSENTDTSPVTVGLDGADIKLYYVTDYTSPVTIVKTGLSGVISDMSDTIRGILPFAIALFLALLIIIIIIKIVVSFIKKS